MHLPVAALRDVANKAAPVYKVNYTIHLPLRMLNSLYSQNVATSLDGLKKHNPKVFGPLILTFEIDALLNTILIGLNIILIGVIKLIAAS